MLFGVRLALAVLAVAACSRAPRDPLSAVSEDVRAGRYSAAAARIAAAELPERPALAYRAASDAPAEALVALAAAAVEPELSAAVADRLEHDLGPKAALAARERAAAAAPDRAEHHDALARARLAAGQRDASLAAWDRAAELAPLQPQYRLAPIRALVAQGDRERACARAATIAAAANDVERLLVATSAAAACGDHARAIELARAARDLRPGDGRLAFNFGERLADAGDPTAAQVLTARRVREALDAPRACSPVDAPDLTGYLASLRAKLK
jgi:tetratricopeptide (TPR) repeat protein